MTPDKLKSWLQQNSEPEYGKFSASLLPGVKKLYGVRLPLLRKMAAQIAKENNETFFDIPGDGSFEETMLQGMVIALIKEPAADKQKRLTRFIPKIDNWSICDSLCAGLKDAGKNRGDWWPWIKPMMLSEREFTVRFGIVMFLFHFMTADYLEEGFALLNQCSFPGYYAQTAAGWAIAEAYAKLPGQTLAFLQRNSLPAEVQNKGIRKICESLRITAADKQKIRKLKK